MLKTIKKPSSGKAACPPRLGRKGRLKSNQNGMTLLEVLVAMFVLAIGVLALLATQLRSVSGVREAESQTIVAQAVQNLIEGMLINPDLSAATNSDGKKTGWTLKSYDAYLTSGAAAAACEPEWSGAMSKEQLATAQLCQFSNDLVAALPEGNVRYTVCLDNSGAQPTAAGNNVDFHCDGNGSNYVVKVAWQMDNEEEGIAASQPVMNETRVVYSYQARVTQ
ncbi:MAG: type IV pilus modification protein PilV [Neisseria sp.]|nr:type IV pilus modification protein PilV [Neisseria sp.]